MIEVRLLAISGSLRQHSSNTEVLRAIAGLAPPPVSVELEPGIGLLPFFNPDLDQEGMSPPAPVADFRRRIAVADGIFICSPEYAHGVSGVLKNALDWLVSGPEIVGKPIGLLNTSARSAHAQAALAETLRTMSTALVPGASVVVPLDGRRLDADAIAADPLLNRQLQSALDALLMAARGYQLEYRDWRTSGTLGDP